VPTSIVLLADDLSGALDSASPFRLAGHEVAVAIDTASAAAAMRADPAVLAINLDCRTLAADAAAARIRLLDPVLAPLTPRLVMLKVDSRLKGPVSSVVESAMAMTRRRDAVICPAIPDVGRVVAEGHVIGAGVDRPIRVTGCLPAGPAIVCRDAADAGALRDIAASILGSAETTLAIGARGLAQALAQATGPGRPQSAAADDPPRLPIILAIGSRDPVTIEQVGRLCRAARLHEQGTAAPEGGAVMLVRPLAGDDAREPADVAARLADHVARIVGQCDGATILASGGDTALAIVRRIGIDVLAPQRELLPGIPLSIAPARPELRIVTKSGGFGGPDALVACLAALTCGAEVPA
jgi:uncharacterized protein YgbK (DUF1537 family)